MFIGMVSHQHVHTPIQNSFDIVPFPKILSSYSVSVVRRTVIGKRERRDHYLENKNKTVL